MLYQATLFVIAVLLTTFIVNRLLTDDNDNVVQLSHGGKVRGNILHSENGRPFYAFRGIRYGEAPTGKLRFKAPVPKKAWTEEFDATKEGPECPYVDVFVRGVLVGQEDCLSVNVYTPELPQAGKEVRKKDVLFYIHGGGFMSGSGATNFVPPQKLMDTGNVVVSVSYRLDALGFLSTEDDASPGNYGLFDQSLALQWVQDNVAAFGGNPGSVTIFGYSAGGASVSYHIISPQSKGLFHRAMPMSGSSLDSWAFEERPLRWAKHLAAHVGCPEEPSTALVECLRGKPVEEVIPGMNYYGEMLAFPMNFVPSLDGKFIQWTPYDIYFKHPDTINKIPVMTGITEAEGSLFFGWAKMLKPHLEIASDEFIQYYVNCSVSGQIPDVIEDIKKRYLSETDKEDEDALITDMVKIFSDGLFKMEHYLEVKALATVDVPVYVYSYEYRAKNMVGSFEQPPKYGVTHGEDLYMYFDLGWLPKLHYTNRDLKMQKFLLKMLSNFAKTGNPDPAHEIGVAWTPSEPDRFNILRINDTLSLQDHIFDNPDQEFWLAMGERTRNQK